MTAQFADIARQAAAEGAISAEDILQLRMAGWGDGAIEPDEAEAIFALNDALAEPTHEWSDFFVEAIGEYVVNGTEPKGYVSFENASWLIARVARDNAVQSLTELELLVRVLERSRNAPETLKAYVIAQVERAVMSGSGPTRQGGALVPGQVSEGEARILRRVLFSSGGDGPASVSRSEAELLFRLKDAALDAPNAPEWKRLFVQGVGNYLMGMTSANAQLDRERAAELEAFVADASSHVGRFMGRMAKASPNSLGEVFGKKAPERDRMGELAAAEQVTGDERTWLDTHVQADGEVDEYEQALLDFLAEG